MSAIRAARGFTGKDKIIKFAGCYHGHSDCLLVSAGSGVMASGIPDSAGVPKGCTQDTMTATYNDAASVEALLKQEEGNVAAVIVEAVGANMGVVPPKPGFLKRLRELCDEHNCLLIFDEVITGFRLGIDGAQGWFQVTPDLTTYGKIIGAGMPVGAYGGKREIMETVSPVGPVYQAGTLSGNPVAMAAGITQLTILKENPQIYQHINHLGVILRDGFQSILEEAELPFTVNGIGSLNCLFFTEQSVNDYASAKTADTSLYAKYFQYMLNHGIYLAPAQFEAMFISNAHTEQEINTVLSIANDFFRNEI